MLIADSFVYVHLPKTGGTFVREVLRELLEGAGQWSLDSGRREDRARLGDIGHHGGARDIPAAHRGRPVLSSIRNPYDWYVSHYEFGWWKTKPDRMFDDARARSRYASYPDLSFPQFAEAFNDWHLWPAVDREGTTAQEYAGVGALTLSVVSTLMSDDVVPAAEAVERLRTEGFSSALYPRLHFIRTDSLNADLREFLLGSGFTADEVAYIEGLARIYPREGGRDPGKPWQSYYDPKTKAYVREREAVLFELFPEFDV